MPNDFLFTSESVTEGHPDKICDQISDGVVDALIEKDPHARVAVETLVKTGLAIVAGEVTTTAWVDIPKIVRSTICRIGYTDSSMGYDGNTCGVMVAIEGQSQDIARGVDEKNEQGAGRRRPGNDVRLRLRRDAGADAGADQLRPRADPQPGRQFAARSTAWMRPDGKSQVTVEYEDGKPGAHRRGGGVDPARGRASATRRSTTRSWRT